MIKIDSLERKDGKITVKISVTRFSEPSCRKRIKLMTPEVINFLKESGVKDLGICIKKDKINNFQNKNSGIWIFEEIPKVKKAASTRQETKKIKKTLDKPDKHVIIKVQDKTLDNNEK